MKQNNGVGEQLKLKYIININKMKNKQEVHQSYPIEYKHIKDNGKIHIVVDKKNQFQYFYCDACNCFWDKMPKTQSLT